MNRMLDFDPLTGTSTIFTDNQDGTFSITNMQDVEPIIENNKKLQNSHERKKKGIKEGMWHYGSVPAIIIQKWNIEIGGDILARHNRKEFFKRLNSPEYAYLRTSPGKHYRA